MWLGMTSQGLSGMARSCWAWWGSLSHGTASQDRFGAFRFVGVWFVFAWQLWLGLDGTVSRGKARHGEEWQLRQGKARNGMVSQGESGKARRVKDSQVLLRQGVVFQIIK